ncbi:MAG: type II toxin-antitoxin system VapC family toxin [Thermoleophilia bacterium]
MKSAARSTLFVDTSAWLAVNDPRDNRHDAAAVFYREDALKKFRTLVTSNLVVAETHASLIKARGMHVALKFLELLDTSSRVNVIYSTRELEMEGERILAKYGDQRFSLCDATSFAVMKDNGIMNVFSFDQHFETTGFCRLP